MRVPVALVSLAGQAFAPAALAGVYASPSARWGVFAPRPEREEPTPNYYGYGGSVGLGYSVMQVLDLGVFATYMPGTRKEAKAGEADAELTVYGGELALRLGETIYVGLRGGTADLRVLRPERPEEPTGLWTGAAGAFALAAILPLGKANFMQTGVELMHTVLEPDSGEAAGRRRLDAFSVVIGYAYNGDGSSKAADGSILGDFVRSINFF